MASKYADPRTNLRQRFTDVSSEHGRMMAPIKGYEKMPLVSIDEAIKPLLDHLPGVKQMVDTLKPKCQSPADGLTPDESVAIMLYTFEWTPTESSFYFILNRRLRAADRPQLQPWFLYLKLLIYSLAKLPSESPHVYRGVKEDLSRNYPLGQTFVWWGFSSCTVTIDVLSNPDFLGTVGPRTIFSIETKSAKNIRNHSMMSTVTEILLLAARQFKVVNSQNLGGDLHIIYVKEMEPEFPLLEPLPEPVPIPRSLSAAPRLSVPPYPARWNPQGETLAHGLNCPYSLCVDEEQTMYMADLMNHRILAWKVGAKQGEVVAGGKGQGAGLDQLNWPTDVMMDRESDTLLICDCKNRRVMRWPRHPQLSGTASSSKGDVVIDDIGCWGLAMDDAGALYVSNWEKHEVRRYDKRGDKNGIVVAGGHGKGAGLHQLNVPTYLFVNAQKTLYVSDTCNHRVMKWLPGAKEGSVVAGGNGRGEQVTQLSNPAGVWVDRCGHVYVAEEENHRVMFWHNDARQGTVVVGGNGQGNEANQLRSPKGLLFDRHGHLYVADCGNHRVQRFSLL